MRHNYDEPRPLLPLSGVVFAKNEADRIGACTLRSVCAEVIVLDSGSTDDTVAVARAAGALVEHQDWLGFAAQKNAAIARATQPWLLLLDADEWLAEGAAAELRAMFASNRIEQADAWRVERHNWFLGGRLRRPERPPRLLRRDVRFLPMLVHERPDLAGKRVSCCAVALEHDSARSWEHHLGKLDGYARLWAQQRHDEGRRCGPWSAWGTRWRTGSRPTCCAARSSTAAPAGASIARTARGDGQVPEPARTWHPGPARRAGPWCTQRTRLTGQKRQ